MESPEAKEAVYLFRGTTRGWPGNANSIEHQFTYTSLDPLVATLFAVECRNYGPAIVLMAQRGRFEEIPPGELDEVFQRTERSMTLSILPLKFASQADLILEVDRCLNVLADLGFTAVPSRINGKSHLQNTIEESDQLGHRLTSEQIREFTSRVRGENR